jgi:hypothetical protein
MPTRVTVTIVGQSLPGAACGPHQDVRVALQLGKDRHVQAVEADAREAVFTTELTLKDDDDMTGAAVQGRRGERFIYLAWLERGERRFRRAKLQLDGIPAAELAKARRTGALRAELGLTASDGLPVCASVRPPAITWRATGARSAR